jgi:hypothetical protein
MESSTGNSFRPMLFKVNKRYIHVNIKCDSKTWPGVLIIERNKMDSWKKTVSEKLNLCYFTQSTDTV